ncbi:hypothetical protein BCR44DRAFT_1440525, partial [Catenaria anguillulae PL171]
MTMMMQAAPNSSGLVNQVPARLLPTCGFPRHVSVFSSANQSNWRSPPRGLYRFSNRCRPEWAGWLSGWLTHSPPRQYTFIDCLRQVAALEIRESLVDCSQLARGLGGTTMGPVTTLQPRHGLFCCPLIQRPPTATLTSPPGEHSY